MPFLEYDVQIRKVICRVLEMLGQLRVQRRLEHVLRELVQQPTRADQAHTLLLRLREQPLGKVLLIDDLPGAGRIVAWSNRSVVSVTTVSFRNGEDLTRRH